MTYRCKCFWIIGYVWFSALLDDLDKELNNYIMRCREWYGWHFPELGKVVTDHTTYAKIINLMGFRTNAQSTDFSEILSEDIEAEVRSALKKLLFRQHRFSCRHQHSMLGSPKLIILLLLGRN